MSKEQSPKIVLTIWNSLRRGWEWHIHFTGITGIQESTWGSTWVMRSEGAWPEKQTAEHRGRQAVAELAAAFNGNLDNLKVKIKGD